MDWMYLFYFSLAVLFFFGARSTGRGEWNEDYTSLKQTKALQGIAALGIALHHMAQKTCAPWHPAKYTVHGLDFFVPVGYMLVGVFLFCSGLGLYKSLHTKPDYLKGFFRRRILPIIIAFYLSEFIYTGIRLLMGEKMNLTTVFWYLSGLHMANFNAWYVIVIPFFYLAFWAAFRFCRHEGVAIFWVFIFTLAYTVLGALIDHQNDWWMRGEWWYNSIILFPLGLLFGRFEKQVTRFFRKGYWFWLGLAFAGIFLLFRQSEWLNNAVWGYYGEWGDPLKVQHRVMSAGGQWVVSLVFVTFCFLLMMKIKLGNRAISWLGSVTLEFYLMHGIFVELFGYDFLEISKSIVYIRDVPLYIVVVLACSVPATLLFQLLLCRITALTRKTDKQDENGMQGGKHHTFSLKQIHIRERTGNRAVRLGRFVFPAMMVLFLLGYYLILPSGNTNDRIQVMRGMEVRVPENFSRVYTDSRYVVWKYQGTDKKPGNLILDGDIRDGKARNYSTADAVLAECDWMSDAEIYTNPHGVRMARGFAYYSGSLERRYYIESNGSVLLLCMKEDERYYNKEDCESMILQVAESIQRVQ